MRLGCIVRRLFGLILLVVGIGIILFSESMFASTGGTGGDSAEPIDTTIQAVLAGQGPVGETVSVRGKLKLFKWTTEYEERGGQRRALGTVYDYTLSTVQDGEILILPIRSDDTLDEGQDVEVVGQLLHRAYGRTYIVNIESEPPIPVRWIFIAAGAVTALAGLLFLLRR